MGRPKGLEKTGGRKKGVGNKRSNEFLDLLERHSYNPLHAILKKYDSLSFEDQLKVDLKLLDYTYPKAKDAQIIPVISEKSSSEFLTDEQIRERNKMYREVLTSHYSENFRAKEELDLIAKMNPIAVKEWLDKNG